MLYLWIWIIGFSFWLIVDSARGVFGLKSFVGALIWPVLMAVLLVMLPALLVKWVVS